VSDGTKTLPRTATILRILMALNTPDWRGKLPYVSARWIGSTEPTMKKLQVAGYIHRNSGIRGHRSAIYRITNVGVEWLAANKKGEEAK